jgi:predicted enzyme related to lactoylglutathione lyase
MRFCRFILRTTDAPAARTFYRSVLGDDSARILPLHEEAIARGAPPHWLGMIGVDDVSGMADAFVTRGAVRLGPTQRNEDGEFAVLRDPTGAVVSLATPSELRPPLVDWHVLNTPDASASASAYAALFGWYITVGGHALHPFAWSRDQRPSGALADIKGRADRHPHWLYFFGVPTLARALEAVRAGGGNAIVSPEMPGFAVCEDGQGVAFGLAERDAPRPTIIGGR